MAVIILPSLDEYPTENWLRSHHQINRGNPLEKFVALDATLENHLCVLKATIQQVVLQ
ncbi:MAG: hypothetical protein RMY63_25100 [Nostoc sp. ChiQUE01b]|nr:hypothetical protein [Nostoc sp. ChiQUE01b]